MLKGRKRTAAPLLSVVALVFLSGQTCVPQPSPCLLNSSPVADAGPDLETSQLGVRMTLNANGSSDADGDALSYHWTLVRGAAAVTLDGEETAAPSFIPPLEGMYEFSVTVSDTCGASDEDTMRVSVGAAPPASYPVARARTDQPTICGGLVAQLNGSLSEDPGGMQLTFRWRQTSGPSVDLLGFSTATPSFTVPMVTQDTQVCFELTVSNGNYSAADTICITTLCCNCGTPVPPVANAGQDQTVNEGTQVTLNGSASYDPQGLSLTFTWLQTGGPPVSLSNPNAATATFTSPVVEGQTTLTFRLTVANGSLSASDTVDITVVDTGSDVDGDGIPDIADNCPGVPNPDQADGDTDSGGDACDGCPADSGKIAPGVCGCNVADTDSDEDGTADCQDQCPSDPNKTQPGMCGCGLPEIPGCTANAAPTVSNPTVTSALMQGQAGTVTASCAASDIDGTVVAVIVDLSTIGGSISQDLSCLGGENWSWTGTVTPTSSGPKTCTFRATDDLGATGTGQAFINVAPAPICTTTAGGTVASNTTWSLASSPYCVTNNVLVNAGVTLTIEAGVRVQFSSGRSMQINGQLIARGTSGNPIVFTSGTGSSPGSWAYVYFTDTSTDATLDTGGNYVGGSILQNAVIEYAGSATLSENGALRIEASSPFINQCTIQHNKADGIHVWNGGTPRITSNTISWNGTESMSATGIYFNSAGVAVIRDNTISSNKGGGVYSWSGASTISGNNISDNEGGGVYGFDGTFSGNSVTGNAGDGINCSGTITNNTVRNNGGFGVANGTTISNNTITGNMNGGIVGGAIISNNTITDNTANYGGGIQAWSATITSNVLRRNMAFYQGGGIYGSGGGIVSDNTISENKALDGAGIFWSGEANITGNTIASNNTGEVPTGRRGGGIFLSSGNPSISANCITGNVAAEGTALYNANASGSANLVGEGNYWGTTDANAIAGAIWDYFDDSSLGIVDFQPFLSSCP